MKSSASPDPELDRLRHALMQRLGLEIPVERWGYLSERIRMVPAQPEGNEEWDGAHQPVSWDEAWIGRLASVVTVGETYFFRDTALFHALQAEILPALIASGRSGSRSLAIGSAGCSTGEEIYSVAILLRNLVPDLAGWHLTLAGVDINIEAVQKARQGRYGKWSFRETPEYFKRVWFSPAPGCTLQLKDEIRRLVQFNVANLASSEKFPFPPGTFDLLFCRNVLMYFQRGTVPSVIDRLVRALRPGGILILAPTELHFAGHPQLEMRQAGSTYIFAKKPHGFLITSGSDGSALGPIEASEMAAARLAASSSEFSRSEEIPAVRVDSTPLESVVRQAHEFADRGQLDAARKWAKQALEIDPLQASMHLLLGTIAQEQNDLACAREFFKKAAFLDPDSVLAHFHLGMIALREQHFGEARAGLQRALCLLRETPRATDLVPYRGSSARDLQRMIQIMLEKAHD